jgi:hypothetical protein
MRDVVNGAVWGDFARHLGPAGVITQIVFGYIPVVGTLTALRDLIANLGAGDVLGMILNGIALFPVLGGFAKTAEIIHHARRLRGSFTSSGETYQVDEPLPGSPAPRNGWALLSFLIGLMVPIIGPAIGIGVVTWLAPAVRLTSTLETAALLIGTELFLPLVTIIAGHAALRRARSWPGHRGQQALARIGLGLGYLYLIVLGAAFALVVYFATK